MTNVVIQLSYCKLNSNNAFALNVILLEVFFHGGSLIYYEKIEKTGSFCFGNSGKQSHGVFKHYVHR